MSKYMVCSLHIPIEHQKYTLPLPHHAIRGIKVIDFAVNQAPPLPKVNPSVADGTLSSHKSDLFCSRTTHFQVSDDIYPNQKRRSDMSKS